MKKPPKPDSPHRVTVRLPLIEISGSGYGLLVVCLTLVGIFAGKALGLW